MNKRIMKILISILLSFLLLMALSGCITIRMQDEEEELTSDPIIGEWSVVRVNIVPTLPLPEILINQVISEKATWKFSQVNGKLNLKFDGSDTWYKIPMGITINRKPVTVSEISEKAPYVFIGGGTVDLSQGLLALLLGHKIEQGSVDFTDEIQVRFITKSQIGVVITVMASGKYYGEREIGGMKWKTLQEEFTITYDDETLD